MFGDGSLTLQEFVMNEPVPLARIHDAVLQFLRHRDDAVLFGAQAVNAYVDEPRMTQDVDILSNRAELLAEEIRLLLSVRFQIAARVRSAASGKGFRVFQLREPKNRHLVDIRQVEALPSNRLFADVRVLSADQLIAYKIISMVSRANQAKGDTDRRDLKLLLLVHPELKTVTGPVRDCLTAARTTTEVMAAWDKTVASEIEPELDDGEF